MAITDLQVTGYRSIRDVWLKLKPINVIVGANGTGKSNLYRAMYLLSAAATGHFARAIAEEGGMQSVLWAGERKKKEKYLTRLSVRVDKFEYNLVCGVAGDTVRTETFYHDPVIRKEEVFLRKGNTKSTLLKRGRAEVKAREAGGKLIDYTLRVPDNESVLTGLREPHKFPELFQLRQELLSWRFYHKFRTDLDSPLRKPQLSVSTQALSHDGQDFAAALATIREAGNAGAMENALNSAFPGSELLICKSSAPGRLDDRLRLSMRLPGFNRFFEASELSDGTLQYLCLLAALLSLRAPSVLALNEPETSIHPDLYEPLAKLIVDASRDSQIWITTHSRELSDFILEYSGCEPLELEKVDGETRLVGVGLGGYKEDDEDEESDEEQEADDDDDD